MRRSWRRSARPVAAGRAIAVGLTAALALAGCAQVAGPGAPGPKPVLALSAVSYADLPGWQQDKPAEALPGFLAGCHQLEAFAGSGSLGGQGLAATQGGQPASWQPACRAAAAVPPGDDTAARRFVETYFQPYAISDSAAPSASRSRAFFTGYFDPEVRGSRSPGAGYRVALFGRPGDLVQVDLGSFSDDLHGRSISGRVDEGRLVPYYDRADIDGGALAKRRLELIWLADPIDAFFLQIQGSGRVDLPDGHVVRVTYAGQNGRPYVPIGRVLADKGEIPLDQVSLFTIRAWLEKHPDQAQAVMEKDPSFVFFREVDTLRPDQGPPGALGVPLTPGRSVAVDRSFIPLGAPLYIDTTDPVTGAKLQRLVLAQDLGGAIKGPARADIFFGWGRPAEERAGKMRADGRAYLLLPKGTVRASLP
jgi:membrane-bound lytic murein transglycosylase A